jgi:nucleotide-binding universal stress UspA family protein
MDAPARGKSRFLLAVDGSRPAERAVRHVIGLHAAGLNVEVLLLNVQPEWAPPRSKEDEREGKRLHAKAAAQATRSARALLDRAGVPYEERMLVGPPGESIVNLARARRCSQIVVGSRGLGAVARVVLGSVSLKVLQLADVPVTLVR